MTLEEMTVLFEKHSDEYLKFKNIQSPRSLVPDLCAFLILESIAPTRTDIVVCAEHDEIWLSHDPEAVAANATEDQLLDLIRCGVLWDGSVDSFRMNV